MELIDEPEPGHFAKVVLEIHKQLSEPRRVFSDMQPADQRRPVGIRPLEHSEELPRRGFPKRGDNALADVLPHRLRLGGTVPASTTTFTVVNDGATLLHPRGLQSI